MENENLKNSRKVIRIKELDERITRCQQSLHELSVELARLRAQFERAESTMSVVATTFYNNFSKD